jgi:hypothetical protein
MLQAHSPLWHYLWVAPNVLLLFLAFLMLRRHLHRVYPFFFIFALLGATAQLTLYVADILRSIDGPTWWRMFRAEVITESVLKFALIGEIFSRIFDAYPSLAKVGRISIRAVGVFLVLAAALAAAFSSEEGILSIISGTHVLEQTVYLIECGLLVFIFLFSAYFQLAISRPVFGIALGLAISACVHLADWAMVANGRLADRLELFDFVNMATYHVCVLIWYYYLLVPQEAGGKPPGSLPPNNLDVWNKELERLLQR